MAYVITITIIALSSLVFYNFINFGCRTAYKNEDYFLFLKLRITMKHFMILLSVTKCAVLQFAIKSR